ncbi:MAG: sigma-70 family RNA polymerase sigma factor [Oscillibacter sp.]|nr:sigma-70 family RNA polymerase sigma factor [Oscillibacter sp.]
MLSLLLFANTLLLTLRLSNGGSFPKPLTAAEEREWLARLSDGDPKARNVLIERNLRLVAHIVKKYYTQSAEQEDLISIGTIGLIKAISTFNPSKGVRLATYAARCIENAILSQARFAKQETPGQTPGVPFWLFAFVVTLSAYLSFPVYTQTH